MTSTQRSARRMVRSARIDTENFDRSRMFAARAHAGGVDEKILLAVAFVGDVDRVARRAGNVAHDRAFIVQDGIDQR